MVKTKNQVCSPTQTVGDDNDAKNTDNIRLRCLCTGFLKDLPQSRSQFPLDSFLFYQKQHYKKRNFSRFFYPPHCTIWRLGNLRSLDEVLYRYIAHAKPLYDLLLRDIFLELFLRVFLRHVRACYLCHRTN